MKQKIKHRLATTILVLLTVISLKSQTYCTSTLTPNCELLCNGGFETRTGVPQTPSAHTGIQYLPLAAGWDNDVYPNSSVDLFSTSSPTNILGGSVAIPCNYVGYQTAHSGTGYAGLFTVYPAPAAPHAPTNIEFMQSPLATTLTLGKIYEVSLWVSRADLSKRTINGLGVWLTGYPTVDPPSFNCPVSSLNNDAWTKITFPYCSDGTESYIIIGGNSTVLGNTITASTSTCVGNNPNIPADGYIYIDDVSVKEAIFTVASQSVCVNSTFTVAATTPTNVCAVTHSLYTYSWNHGDGSAAVNTGTNSSTTYSYTSYGTYTGTLSVSTGSCAVSYTYNVFVPNVPITITSNSTTICNGITSFTAIAPSSFYVWTLKDAATGTVIPTSNYTITSSSTATPSINFANINQNVNVCASMTTSLGCSFTQCIYLPSCCATPTNVMKYTNTTYSTTVAPAAVAGFSLIAFSGTITVNSGGYLIITSKDVRVDPNTKFIINGNGRIAFNSDYVHGCNYMWDGIYANTTNSITINNTRVEDAKRVIVDSLGTASINITSSYLNKNYMGVVIKAAKTSPSGVTIRNTLLTCAAIPTTGVLPKIPTVVNLTNAATLGAYSTTTLMAPYNTTKSYCGIQLQNASHTGKTNAAIVIGGTAINQENVFDKLQSGVLVDGSSASFQNNVFQNMKSSINPAYGLVGNCGILTFYLAGGSPSLNTNVGGSVALKNTFINNDYGVYNTGKTTITASYNKFTSQDHGIYVTNNNGNRTVNLAHNKLVNNRIGINFNANTLINANVLENWFDNTTAQGDINNNFAIRFTEAVPATNFSTYAYYEANNNYINGYRNGIYVNNTYSSKIKDNEVHLRPDNTAGTLVGGNWLTQSGIRMESTNTNDVFNNLVDMPSSNPLNWGQSGILTGLSSVIEIHCNYMNYLGTSMVANSLNNTAAGKGIYGNSMNNTGVGFWLNGEIGGDQYYFDSGTNYSADNSWSNCPVETNVNSNCNAGGNKFFTRAANPYKINNPTNTLPSNPLTGTNNSTGFTTACYGSVPTPTLNLKLMGTTPTLPVMQNANDIALNTINYGTYNQSMQYMAQKQLFENLTMQPTLSSTKNNSTTGSFMGNCKQNNIGAFYIIDSLINTGDSASLNEAIQLNNALSIK